ncbi:MAG: hypothetical protein DCC67_05935 [Planctomycetota bacterium]|nr:MAG: hypothetical protein DCC67_05935 [Planctomycetota bacterium]
MKRLLLLAVVCSVVVSSPLAAQGQEGVPDLRRHYHFVPRLSRVVQTGGIAGVHIEYRVIGKYDLITASRPWSGTARFENAEAWGSIISPLPAPAVVLDVDEAFNLEGLKGEQLPVAAPFDVFRFTGETADGSSVQLFASMLGRWMYLRGETTPPKGSADFFEYQLRALARQRPFADFNGDGVVDRNDLEHWAAPSSSGAPQAAELADANDDLLSDGADFLDWQRQYGETAPDVSHADALLSSLLASGSPAVAGVPEPATAVLALAALAALVRRRHRS